MEYKAVIEPVSGLVVQAPMRASSGNVTYTIHAGAEAWAPPVGFWWRVGQIAPPRTNVHIHPRKDVERIWRGDNPVGAFPSKPYAFRAYNNERNNVIRMFVDETETVESLCWGILHEIAHSIVSATPDLAYLRNVKKPTNYETNDDAHASHPEEKFANAFADRHAPAFGLSKGMDRHWWRRRMKARGYGAPEDSGFPWLGVAMVVGIAYLWSKE